MTNQIQNTSPILYAKLAGLAYLILIICGLFSELYVRGNLIVDGNASATATNILANTSLFRIGFMSDLVMLICDVIVGVLLYILLRPVSKTLAILALAFRLIMNAILGINLLTHFYVLILLSDASYLSAFSTEQLHGFVSVYLEAHSIGYAIGLIYFALHCFFLGILIYKSQLFPKILGFLLVAASFSYLIDSSAIFILPDYRTENYPYIMLPALIAELSLCFWLLFRGTKDNHTNDPALQSRNTQSHVK